MLACSFHSPALPQSPSGSSSNAKNRQQSSSFSRGSPQPSLVTPSPVTIDDSFYGDLLNLTDAEYLYLYEDLLFEGQCISLLIVVNPRWKIIFEIYTSTRNIFVIYRYVRSCIIPVLVVYFCRVHIYDRKIKLDYYSRVM